MDDFIPLYTTSDAVTENSGPASNETSEPDSKKRKTRKFNPYILNVGPRFRSGHETPWKATNEQMMSSEENGRAFMESVVRTITDGARFSSQCDVILSEYIHPESPKLISIALGQLDMDEELNENIGNMSIPLYLSLTKNQWEDVMTQCGIDEKSGGWSIEMNRNRDTSSAKTSGVKKATGGLERFINDVLGRFGKYNVSFDSSWDKNERFFQKIQFAVRVAPQNKFYLPSLSGVQRGAGELENDNLNINRDTRGDASIPSGKTTYYKSQNDQFEKINDGELHLKNNPALEEIRKDREDDLQNLKEDGSEQAVVPQHVFEMTSHMALSPTFKGAIEQALALLDMTDVTKQEFEDRILANPAARVHMMTIIEIELKEIDITISRYQDPQALKQNKKRKIFAAYSLKKLV